MKSKKNDKITSLKSILFPTLLFILAVNITSGVFAKRDLTYMISATISSLLGMAISIIIVYYFLNNRSFGSIDQTKGNILILFTLPLFLGFSLGIYFALEFIITSF